MQPFSNDPMEPTFIAAPGSANFPGAEIPEPKGKRKVPEYSVAQLLFSICVRENANPKDLSSEVFTDWLRDLPIAAESVRVESAFKSH
jgi:hypothetical protein